MMDAKYFAEIRKRCELGRPEQQREVKALLAEVERLNKMLADSFQGQLLNELDAKDQQIATLKKALKRAEEHINEIYSYLDYDYCGSCQQVKEAVEDYRYGIQQAQGQEAKDEKV